MSTAVNFKMVVQYLSCEAYAHGKRFYLPRRVKDSVYSYEIVDNEVRVFEGTALRNGRIVLGRWDIPIDARSMEFMVLGNNGERSCGPPIFYDEEGRILKIGNR